MIPLVETGVFMVEMGPTEPTTTINDAGAAGRPHLLPLREAASGGSVSVVYPLSAPYTTDNGYG
jgi:hypothetical protein